MTDELVKRLRDAGFQYSANPLVDEAADALESETKRADGAEARVRELEAQVLRIAFAAAQLLAHDYDATEPGRWPERQLRELLEKIRDRLDAEEKQP